MIFTGNSQIVSRRKKNFKKPSGLSNEDIRGALLRNKVDITQEFGNAPAPVPGASKLGSVSEFTQQQNITNVGKIFASDVIIPEKLPGTS